MDNVFVLLVTIKLEMLMAHLHADNVIQAVLLAHFFPISALTVMHLLTEF
jgi:hypothetical protein